MTAKEVYEALLSSVREGLPGGNEDDSVQIADMSKRTLNVMAAALAVLAEILRDRPGGENLLIEFWALSIKLDEELWHSLLNSLSSVDQLDDNSMIYAVKKSLVSALCRIAKVDAELGKLPRFMYPGFGGGNLLDKSLEHFFGACGQKDAAICSHVSNLVRMAVSNCSDVLS